MQTAVTGVIDNFKSFTGTGWVMWLIYGASLLYLFWVERPYRKQLVTVSLVLCVLVINPVTYRFVGERFLSGVYWRLFWTFPIVIVAAAALTLLVGKLKKGVLRVAAVAVLCLAIALTGQRVINRGTYTAAENDYQIPQAAIDVADAVMREADMTLVRIIAPDDLVCYIRQYTSLIKLAYGRDVQGWGYIGDPNPLEQLIYDLLHEEEVDYAAVREAALTYQCAYVVIDVAGKELPDDMEELGYRMVEEVDHYAIFDIRETSGTDEQA
jgi:hypothetical protein